MDAKSEEARCEKCGVPLGYAIDSPIWWSKDADLCESCAEAIQAAIETARVNKVKESPHERC